MGSKRAVSADVWASPSRGSEPAAHRLRGAAAALFFGLAAMAGGASVSAQQAAAPKPAQIDRNGVLILIRSTLIALDQANKTGNYSVLRDLGAPGFQVNSDARLAEIFASERRDKLDLSGVAVLEPQLTLLPEIEPNGMMRMAGFFPSVPTQVRFELLFQPVDGQWRPFGISVGLASSSPVAPKPQPQAALQPDAGPAAHPRPAPRRRQARELHPPARAKEEPKGRQE